MYPENSNLFEALRFGSSIPGGYWGCCAGDVFQCFKSDPDEPASIELVCGDGGEPLEGEGGGSAFLGPTNRDVFLGRLRIGTFGLYDLANHFFIAVLTEAQVKSSYGKKWLALLKESGFEYIRTVNNSVWTGGEQGLNPEPKDGGRDRNHVFALFRNIGKYNNDDNFTPPKAWTELPSVKKEAYEFIPQEERKQLTLDYITADTAVWERVGPAKLLSEQEVRDAGAPVILAGQRSENPQEPKENREARRKTVKTETWPASPVASAFPAKLSV